MTEEFEIPSKALFEMLTKKGVTYLYHANTVATSLSFFSAGALISRHEAETNGLQQSFQKSDGHDKKHDVWDFVYLDGTDHHRIYSQSNFYGPVLFRMKLEMLNSPKFPTVFIMKYNPMNWNDKMTLEDKFYKTIEEADAEYLTKKKLDSQTMFTFKSPGRTIDLKEFLDSVGIDEPSFKVKLRSGEEIDLAVYIRKVIQKGMDDNGLGEIKLLRRNHTFFKGCICWGQYNYMYKFDKNEFRRRFDRTAV
jgi:hypothetical protein